MPHLQPLKKKKKKGKKKTSGFQCSSWMQKDYLCLEVLSNVKILFIHHKGWEYANFKRWPLSTSPNSRGMGLTVAWGQRSNWALGYHSWGYFTPSWPRPCFGCREASWSLCTGLAGSGPWPLLPNVPPNTLSRDSPGTLDPANDLCNFFLNSPKDATELVTFSVHRKKLIYDLQWMSWGTGTSFSGNSNWQRLK